MNTDISQIQKFNNALKAINDNFTEDDINKLTIPKIITKKLNHSKAPLEKRAKKYKKIKKSQKLARRASR